MINDFFVFCFYTAVKAAPRERRMCVDSFLKSETVTGFINARGSSLRRVGLGHVKFDVSRFVIGADALSLVKLFMEPRWLERNLYINRNLLLTYGKFEAVIFSGVGFFWFFCLCDLSFMIMVSICNIIIILTARLYVYIYRSRAAF